MHDKGRMMLAMMFLLTLAVGPFDVRANSPSQPEAAINSASAANVCGGQTLHWRILGLHSHLPSSSRVAAGDSRRARSVIQSLLSFSSKWSRKLSCSEKSVKFHQVGELEQYLCEGVV